MLVRARWSEGMRPLKIIGLGPDRVGFEPGRSSVTHFAPSRHAKLREVVAAVLDDQSKQSYRCFSAHTFDTDLSVASHNLQEPRHFDGTKPKQAFRPLPTIKIRSMKNLNASNAGLSKSFDGATSMKRDPENWMQRREPTARLQQELEVFLSGQNHSWQTISRITALV